MLVKSNIDFFVLLILIFALMSCATVSGPQNLTHEIIVNTIIEGKTGKEEVLELLGKPDSKIIHESGITEVPGPDGSRIDLSETMPYETWAYAKIEQRLTKDSLLVGTLTGAAYYPTQISTLAINFDKNGIVQNYTFTESGY